MLSAVSHAVKSWKSAKVKIQELATGGAVIGLFPQMSYDTSQCDDLTFVVMKVN